MRVNKHLSDQAIESLLTDAESSKNDSVALEHLEHCERCQARLHENAAAPWWWKEGQQLFASTAQLIVSQQCISKTSAFDPAEAEVKAITDHFVPAVHPELLGQVDEFQVESLIGVGGMGVVFKAYDQELNRPVAIKFLSPRLADSGIARQRFAREAKSAAAICHDNVIRIFRINNGWVFPFFVMPYVSGRSLKQLVDQSGTLEVEQLVQIATQIASGLSVAHEQGLIHRDIKPANILLENSCNRIVITDFGLVQDEKDIRLTQTGVVAGTPQYMSPEQADGRPLDARSDLFSLGAVMYWMATGSAPFKANGQYELLRNIRECEPKKIRHSNAKIPAGLESIIESLLNKEVDSRPVSAAETETVLRRYSAYLQNPLMNREPRFRSTTASRKWQYVVGAIMLLASIVVAISIATSNPTLRLFQKENQASLQFQTVDMELSKETQDQLKVFANNASKTEVHELAEVSKSIGLIDRVSENRFNLELLPLAKLDFLSQQNDTLARKILAAFELETQAKYGMRDLFVVEPVLLRTQLEIKANRWEEAAYGFHRINMLLQNNFAPLALRNKIAAFEQACINQPLIENESQQLFDRSIVELYPDVSSEFRSRLNRIR